MNFSDIFEKALQAITGTWDEVDGALSQATQDALDSHLQDTAQNRMRHPLLSSTQLPAAATRALATVARLERKHAKTFQEAAVAMLAIEQARLFMERLEAASKLKKDADRDKDLTGIYAQSRGLIDRLWAYGVGKWHIAQQSEKEEVIYADLMRWKAENPDHDDLDSPLTGPRRVVQLDC